MKRSGTQQMHRNLAWLARGAIGLLGWLVSLHTGPATRAQDVEAREQGAEALQVERGQGAEPCPDAASLSLRIDTIRGPATNAANPYHVKFTRESGGYAAAIRRADSAQVARVLNAPGDSCTALAQATAVTLALILDALAEPPSETPPEAVSPPLLVPPPASTPPRELPAVPELRLRISAGAGAVLGVTRNVGPALLAELAVERGAFHGGLGLLWALPSRVSLGPGSLRSQLWSGAARGCYRALQASSWQLALCSGAMLGAIEVSARGFTRNETHNRLWLAIPLELALSFLPGPVGVQAGLGALFSIRREDFSVDGLGAAYHSWPVAALFSLQVVAGWPRAVLTSGAKN